MSAGTQLRSLARDEVRNVDQRTIEEFGIPGVILMENAGRGAAELLIRRGVDGTVVICCGKGNNGGDGFVIARHLDQAGIEVEIWLFADASKLSGDALTNYEIAKRSRLRIHEHHTQPSPEELTKSLASADWIVDTLLGTGIQGEVKGDIRGVIEAINSAGKQVLAVDLPSGLDANTGEPLGVCIQATLTTTFVARKLGFDNPASKQWTGNVEVVDIGLPRALLNQYAD